MKTWKIPVFWTMNGVVEIKADTLEEAIKKAYDADRGLPDDGDYIENSFEVDNLNIDEIRSFLNNDQKDEEE